MSENTVTITMVGMDVDTHTTMREYLTKGQFKSAHASCKTWVEVGKIITRVKAAKAEHKVGGKLIDVVNEFFCATLTKDEIASSRQMAEIAELIVKWHTDTRCNKHHPRSIMAEYKKGKTKTKTAQEKIDSAIDTLKKVIGANYGALSDDEKTGTDAKIESIPTNHAEFLAEYLKEIEKLAEAKAA